ncbi:MAG: SUMF1/EgtB/PvdO family nonheme iron enzyme [Rhodobacteraceae bacterium]|nr:SUMF1/EgtB/PvdO family nonheme iron enzyme [Paracoccaceae bacterium]
MILPIRCGGAIAFRRVDTPVASNWLADESLQLGNSDIAGQEHSESIRHDSIVGSLSLDGAPDDRFYLIGKYEVTRDQYAAVMGEDCPEPSDDGSIAADGMSWFDAQAFTIRYTEWLHANAPEQLAADAGPGAFVRLPTEEEWEFAARGGQAVPDAVRRQRLFPMDGPVDTYVWFAGYKSCDGALQPVGLLKPNPLGLFDIIGNAQEYVIDLYRLRTQSRAHGQVGGATARGGSCLTTEARVRTAERAELPLFDPETGQPEGKPYTGFRLSIGAPILTGQTRIEKIHDDWVAFGDTRIQIDPDQDPIEALDDIAEAQEDPQIRDTILEAAQTFKTEMERRNAIEMKSAKSVMLSGMLMIRDYLVGLDDIYRLTQWLQAGGPDPAADAVLARAHERLDITRDVFLAALVHATDDFEQTTLDTAEKTVGQETRMRLQSATDRTRATTERMLSMFGEFTRQYRAQTDTDPSVFYHQIEEYYSELTGR